MGSLVTYSPERGERLTAVYFGLLRVLTNRNPAKQKVVIN